jgi:zinc protease
VVDHKQTSKDTGMIMFGYRAPSIFERKDFAAMTVVDAILSGYEHPGGWLHNELRGAGLVYFVEAFCLTGPAPGFFVVVTQTDPPHIAEVITRIEKNLDKVKAGGFSPAEFHTAVQMILAMHAQSDTTIAGQARRDALDELYGLGYDYDKGFDARIEAVTPEEVTRVSRTYLTEHILVTSSPEKP